MSEIITLHPNKAPEQTGIRNTVFRVLGIQSNVRFSKGARGAIIEIGNSHRCNQVVAYYPPAYCAYEGDLPKVDRCLQGSLSWDQGIDGYWALLRGQSVDPGEYGPALIPRVDATHPGDLDRLIQTIACVQIPEIKAFLCAVFAEPEIYRPYVAVPSSLKYHHNRVGGNLEHSLDTLDIALRMHLCRNQTEQDLLIVGALLHDIGKIRVYDTDNQLTGTGRLVHHASLTGEILAVHLRALHTQSPNKANLIRHLLDRGDKHYPYPISMVRKVLAYADGLSAAIEAERSAFQDKPDYYWYGWDNAGCQWIRVMEWSDQCCLT
ncbi:MAG: hypothetical protein C0631_13290 [Sedimenticola sp.]|nr:MAG: hypothetical protein C0631_13290 [Sedimenticola sp.]